tara:strand:+ start:97 stop:660 length:564 start_codon:yes stop_codon:yes gene_type:complete
MAIGSSKDAAGKVKAARNPFTGMTLAQMKKKYSAMTPAQRKANVETFRAAAKTARKPVAKGGSKPRQTTKAETTSRFYSSSSGTRGNLRPSQPASPTVTRQRKESDDPRKPAEDPRMRQLRKNRQEAAAAARRRRAADRPQRGAAARRNRERAFEANKPKEGATKKVQMGPKKVTMVYRGGRWTPKK